MDHASSTLPPNGSASPAGTPLGIPTAELLTRVRPSALKTLHDECAARAPMEAAAARLTEGRLKQAYAQTGITVHDQIHSILSGKTSIDDGLQEGAIDPKVVPFLRNVEETVDNVRRMFGPSKLVLEEQFPPRADGTGSGRPDAMLIPEGVLNGSAPAGQRSAVLFDWKSGFMAVPADTPQARDYAASMARQYNLDSVVSVIIQPNQEPAVHKFTAQDFAEAEAYHAQTKAKVLNPDVVATPGRHCSFCSAAVVCSALRGEVARISALAAEKGIENLGPGERGLVAESAFLADKSAEGAKSIGAYLASKEGVKFPDFSLSAGRTLESVPQAHNGRIFAALDKYSELDSSPVTAAHREAIFGAVKSVSNGHLLAALNMVDPSVAQRLEDTAIIERRGPVFEADKEPAQHAFRSLPVGEAARELQGLDIANVQGMSAFLVDRLEANKVASSLRDAVKNQAIEEGEPAAGFHVRPGNRVYSYEPGNLARAHAAVEGHADAERLFWHSLTLDPKQVRSLIEGTGDKDLLSETRELIISKKGDDFLRRSSGGKKKS